MDRKSTMGNLVHSILRRSTILQNDSGLDNGFPHILPFIGFQAFSTMNTDRIDDQVMIRSEKRNSKNGEI